MTTPNSCLNDAFARFPAEKKQKKIKQNKPFTSFPSPILPLPPCPLPKEKKNSFIHRELNRDMNHGGFVE